MTAEEQREILLRAAEADAFEALRQEGLSAFGNWAAVVLPKMLALAEELLGETLLPETIREWRIPDGRAGSCLGLVSMAEENRRRGGVLFSDVQVTILLDARKDSR